MRILKNDTTQSSICTYLVKDNQYCYVQINTNRTYIFNDNFVTEYHIRKTSILNNDVYHTTYELFINSDETLHQFLPNIFDNNLGEKVDPNRKFTDRYFTIIKPELERLIRNDKLNEFIK